MKKILAFLIIAWCSVMVCQAQTCTAKAQAKVGINQQLPYIVTIHQDGKVTATDFGSFKKVNGPSQHTEHSYSYSNGKQSTSYSITFTYILKPTKTGKQTIPGVTCTIDGKTVKSNAVTVEVTQEDQQTQQQQQQRQRRSIFDDFFNDDWGMPRQQQQQQAPADIFIRAHVSNAAPYQGEVVTVSYKLYARNTTPYQYSIKKMPQSTDLWSYRLDDPDKKPKESVETIDGKRYTVIEIYKAAMAPQKSGTLTIAPLETELVVINGSGFWATTAEKQVKSNNVTLNVKALPAGKPDDFCGLVGQFSLTSTLSPTHLNVNDAADLTVTISGKGSIQLADNPDFNFPSNFDVTDPVTDDHINTSNGIVSGKRTLKYVLIPRQKGTYIIPATSLSYFDPSTKTYKTLTTEKFKLQVEGEGVVIDKKKDEAKGNNDGAIDVTGSVRAFFNKYLFLFILIPILILAVILTIVLIGIIKKRKGEKDKTQKIVRHANRIANRRLKKANKLMSAGKDAEFFEEISHALWDYLSHKFHIPLAELSIDTVRNKLTDKGANEEDIQQFTSTLDDCEYARFAPGDKAEMMNRLYEQARDFITRMERK
ncbi:MAG: BatD family protein [Bacteroidales bacterium]|nr:BatD family protein [Bacteroidales bacterium]